jgi:parallel beta-helix repeat protein
VWLDINAPPSLTDKVNLGGGVFLNRATSTTVNNCVADGQANGYDIYNSVNITVSNCSGCDNLGWGVHLYNTTDSTVASNIFDRNIRKNDGDSVSHCGNKQHALLRSQPSTTATATSSAPLLATTDSSMITTTAQCFPMWLAL